MKKNYFTDNNAYKKDNIKTQCYIEIIKIT